MGPRQVGKTTVSQAILEEQSSVGCYWNWDILSDREKILAQKIPDFPESSTIQKNKPLLVLDEIHKYSKWKDLLKGYFDAYRDRCQILVTGSAHLKTFNQSGDSLLGRYFSYRMHPLSIGELDERAFDDLPVGQLPSRDAQEKMEALLAYGGFPEPFYAQNARMHRRWSNMRRELLFREDLRELTDIKDLAQMELLAKMIEEQASGQLNYSSLAKKVRVSVDTIRRWIQVLNGIYFSFTITPYSRNITNAIIKEPKIYLWDWSGIKDEGARVENLVASQLLKFTHLYNDTGQGEAQLHYLRTKAQEEVDFVVTLEKKPWLHVEVKNSPKPLGKSLQKYHVALQPKYSFQVVRSMDFIPENCFTHLGVHRIPLSTFLGSLV